MAELQDILGTGDTGIYGSVTNLQSTPMDHITFLVEPEEYQGSVGVSYSEEPAVGMSHAHLGFKNTGNERIPITLNYSRNHIALKYKWGWQKAWEEMERQRDFFRALTTPPSVPDGFIGGGPATAHLLIPGILSLPVQLNHFSWTVRKRDPNGNTMWTEFRCEFIEAPAKRWTSEEIISVGYWRH